VGKVSRFDNGYLRFGPIYTDLVIRVTEKIKPDRKTADKTAKINSHGRASRMTAQPHTTSSARGPQDRKTAQIE